MTIEIKNSDLRDGEFMEAIEKLSMFRGFRPRQLDNVARIIKQVRKESSHVQDTFISLVRQYANLDEKGKFVPMMKKDGTPIPETFTIPEEKQEAWKKAQEEFAEIKITLGGFKIPPEDLEGVGLNAVEWAALSPLMRQLSVVEGEDNGKEKSSEKSGPKKA